MTRDEHRAKCASKIMACMGWEDSPGKRLAALSILDSIYGIARVNPIEATEEMIEVVSNDIGKPWGPAREIFAAMSAAGDLTNAPEKKP